MLAWSGPSVVTALAARRLPVAWSGRTRMSAALVVIGVGQVLLWHIVPGDGAARFVPGLLVAGVGSGVLNAALGRESVASVPAGQGALGSGANNTARYLGSALGVTIVSVVAAPSGVVTCATLTAGLEPRRPGHRGGVAGRRRRRPVGRRSRTGAADAPEIQSPQQVDAA